MAPFIIRATSRVSAFGCAFLVVLCLCSCSTGLQGQSANRLTRQGNQLAANGLYAQACREYIKSLERRPTRNVRAMIALQNNAPLALQNMISDFNNLKIGGNLTGAFDISEQITTFNASVRKWDVRLQLPGSYVEDIKEVRTTLAEKHYTAGKGFLYDGEYKSAVNELERASSYLSTYRDTRNLLAEARDHKNERKAEVHYNKGLSYFDRNRFRQAYRSFDDCLRIRSGFRDAEQLKSESLLRGRKGVAVMQFDNNSRDHQIAVLTYTRVLAGAVNCNSPFVNIVDRRNVEKFLEEKRLSMSGIISVNEATETGQLMGMDYVVIGNIANYSKSGGRVSSKNVEAYETFWVKNAEGQSEQKGRKVFYQKHEGSLEIQVEVHYQIVSAGTGTIVKSNVIRERETDQLNFSTYNGDHRNLSNINPDGGNALVGLLSAVLTVNQSEFSARTTFRSEEDLKSSLVNRIARRISNDVCQTVDQL